MTSTTTKATPLDMPQKTPWYPVRVSDSTPFVYAIKGYPGLYRRDGRPFVKRSGRNS